MDVETKLRKAFLECYLDKGGEITLNGQPAKIVGLVYRFPWVVSETERYEWSWSTIKHILQDKNGRFKA